MAKAAPSINYETLNKDPEWPVYLAETERANGLPPGVLSGMYQVESSQGRRLTSPTNVKGPFQVTRDFWKDFGGGKPFSIDPFDQATTAARGLAHHVQRFNGDVGAALNYYRNGALPPDDPKADPAYVGKVQDRMAQQQRVVQGTEPAPGGAAPQQQSRTLLRGVSQPDPTLVGALGDSINSYSNDWWDSLQSVLHPETMKEPKGIDRDVAIAGHVIKVLTPIMAPLAPTGRILAGTAARRAGASDERVKQAESVGDLAGGATHLITGAPGVVGMGTRALTGQAGLTGVAGSAINRARGAIDPDTLAAARAYYEPMRQVLAKNPTAMAAVENKISTQWGPEVLNALRSPVAPPVPINFPTSVTEAAQNLIQPMAKRGVQMAIGSGVGHLLGGHDLVGAVLGMGSHIPDVLISPVARVLSRAVTNPAATMSVAQNLPGAAGFMDYLQSGGPPPAGAAEMPPGMMPGGFGGSNPAQLVPVPTPTPARRLQAPQAVSQAPSGGGLGVGEGLSPEDTERARRGGTITLGPDGSWAVVPPPR